MKTTDLIPLILLELNQSNKYGLEITKSIESISNGKIIIKQPTLYTILKKLEKSKFISSYWEDSDIGGKRHYYKITDNGRQQVSTLPSMQELISNMTEDNDEEDLLNISNNMEEIPSIINSDTDIDHQSISTYTPNDHVIAFDSTKISEPNNNSNNISVIDTIDNSSTTIESTLPSEEVFTQNILDTATEIELNQSNKELLIDDNLSKAEAFAHNKDVTKFIENPATNITSDYKESVFRRDNLTPKITPQEAITINRKEIKYVDYININKNENYIYSKLTAKKMLYKILSTTVYLVLILSLCAIITSFIGTSALYNLCLIVTIGIIIFYPSIFAFKYNEYKDKLLKSKVKYNMKKRLIILMSIYLLILVSVIVINFTIGNNSIYKLMKLNNFANFYAPLLISTAIFADYLFTFLFLVKEKNK